MEKQELNPEGVPERSLIQRVDVRNTAMILLTTVAVLYFISWAQAVLVPLVGAILISYALDPLVSWLEKFHIPRPLGAAFVLTLLVLTIVSASIPLKRETIAILDKAPWAIEQFQRTEARSNPDEEGVVEKAEDVAKKIEESAEDEDEEADEPDVMRVRLWTGLSISGSF